MSERKLIVRLMITTKAWIRKNTNIKDLELDMPEQDGNLCKRKELARKPIIRLEKIHEQREHWEIEKDRRNHTSKI